METYTKNYPYAGVLAVELARMDLVLSGETFLIIHHHRISGIDFKVPDQCLLPAFLQTKYPRENIRALILASAQDDLDSWKLIWRLHLRDLTNRYFMSSDDLRMFQNQDVATALYYYLLFGYYQEFWTLFSRILPNTAHSMGWNEWHCEPRQAEEILFEIACHYSPEYKLEFARNVFAHYHTRTPSHIEFIRRMGLIIS